MIENDDRELRASFRVLRDGDQARAPSFDVMRSLASEARFERVPASTVARDAVPRNRVARPIIFSVAAAALVLAAALATYRGLSRVTPPGQAMPNVPPSITAWKSPTRALLRTPGRELIAPNPLLSSVLGNIRVPTSLPKGGGD